MRLRRWLAGPAVAAFLFSGLAVPAASGSSTASTASTAAGSSAGPQSVGWDGLFHDQGPLYTSPAAPTCSTPVDLTFRTDTQDVTSVNVRYWDTATDTEHWLPMSWSRNDATGRFDLWSATMPASCSVKFYRFQVNDGADTVWYSVDGPQAGEPHERDFWVVPGFSTPQWVHDAVMYQIFPDRFANGDPANDVQTGEYAYFDNPTELKAWGEDVRPTPPAVESSVFFGGDLQGITQNVDYPTGTLGVDTLWMTPIFTSPTNHKYDTQDYFSVDPHLGGDQAFTELVAAWRAGPQDRPGRVVLDGVFNHAGSWSPWFDRDGPWEDVVGAYESQDSPFYDWFTFWDWPDDYAMFFGIAPSMPKLDFGASGSPVRRMIYGDDDSVAQYWIDRFGIDGWRLDAPEYVDAGGGTGGNQTNHEIWREFRAAVKGANPDAYIFGEYWGNALPWLGGDEWDGATNFNGFTNPVSQWITGRDYTGNAASIDTETFDGWLRGTRGDYPGQAQLAMSNHLSNHDTTRFGTRAGGDIWQTYLAHFFQMTYLGVPTIYYGDEYGMQGGADPDNRRTFDWSQADLDNDSVALVADLIEIRRQYPVLRTGSFITLGVHNADQLYAYGRMDADHRIAVLLNNDSTEHSSSIPVYQLSVPDGAIMTDAMTGQTHQVVDGHVSVTVDGHWGAILVHD